MIYADIIALPSDPAQDIKVLQQVKWVMKDSVVYKTMNQHKLTGVN